jgi:hypothetical protein
MDSDWHRLTYWVGQNWPGMVQAACAAATVWITYSLARMNKRYIELTHEQLKNSQRQTEILVQPNLDIKSTVRDYGGPGIGSWYQAEIVVCNKGAYPVMITSATVSWSQTEVDKPVERKLFSMEDCVLPAGGTLQETFRVDEAIKTQSDLGPFHDFLTTTIACRALNGICPCIYRYQPVAGISYRPQESSSR